MASVKDVLKAAGGSVAEKLLIPPGLIDVEPGFNFRIPGPELDGHIDWLIGQIKLRGFDPTQPISVSRSGDRFVVRSGHCRLAAVRRMIEDGERFETVPALLEAAKTNDVERVYQLGTQNGSKAPTDLEWGALVKRQRNMGQTDDQILAGFGKNRAWLGRIMDLAGASHDVQNIVQRNGIGATLAAQIVRRQGAEAGAVIAEAKELSDARGDKRVRPRDVDAVTKPRTEPVSLCSLATAAFLAWRDGGELDEAMQALGRGLGPLAGERVAA